MKQADVEMFKPVRPLFQFGGMVTLCNRQVTGIDKVFDNQERDGERIFCVPVDDSRQPLTAEDVRRLAGTADDRGMTAGKARQSIGGDDGGKLSPVGMITATEQLVAIEVRTELLALVQDIEIKVLRRLRICCDCGKVFLAKKTGCNVKRCPGCRQEKRRS